MRQLTLTEQQKVEWIEVPEPGLEGPGQAIVRPLAVALCDLDLPIIRGQAPIPPPVALGHECVAEVLEIGDEVETVRPGDRVVVPFQISCGECPRCRGGLTKHCETVPNNSFYGFGAFGGDWGGMLSDVLRVPYADAMLVALPDSVSAVTVASASDNIPDGWRTVGPQLAEHPGADVLIVAGGAKSIPLYAVDVAVALGARDVTYIDTDASRLRLAGELGATVIEGPPPERAAGRFAITVDASADHAGLACALRSTEPGGICTSIGIYFEATTPLPLLEMYDRNVTFSTGTPQARPVIPELLELVAAGRIHPERVTSNVVAWDDAAEAVLEPQTKLVVERE